MRLRLTAIVLIAAASARGAEMTFTFPPSLKGAATLELRQIKRVSDLDSPALYVRAVELPQPLVINLPEGTWTVDVKAAGLWQPRQFFRVEPKPSTLPLSVRPASELRGHVAITDQSSLPQTVQVAFTASDKSIPATSIDCPVDAEGAFRCSVPAALLDLRLRAAGCVTTFFWSRELKAGKTHDLGVVSFRRGAAIIGRVEAGRGVKVDRRGIRVTAVAANAAMDSTPAMSGAMKLIPLAGTVEEKGLFHIDGVPPGSYTVTARAGAELRSHAFTVDVRPNVTAELRDVLRIEPPKQLRVFLTPPLDPSNHLWHVELDQRVDDRQVERQTESNASASGEWTASQLFAETYEMKIRSSAGAEWDARTIKMNDIDVTLPIDLTARRLHGVVKAGDKPIAAHLDFFADAASATFQSDDLGYFEGELPGKADRWTVRVKGDAPTVRRHVKAAVVARDRTNDVYVQIALPVGELRGVVVDTKGAPVDHALVNIAGHDEYEQAMSDADGSFAVLGLAPGEYRVEAAGYLVQSEMVKVNVEENVAAEPLRLVVDDVTKIRGRVSSEFGPVPGATVLIHPASAFSLALVNTTDAAGEFSTYVAPDTTELDVYVAAPGFAVRFFRTNIQKGKMLSLAVDQRGGTLTIPQANGERHPFIIHGGTIQAADGVLGGNAAGDGIVLPMIEAGTFSLCMMTYADAESVSRGDRRPANCQSGFLPPYGTLRLEASAPVVP